MDVAYLLIPLSIIGAIALLVLAIERDLAQLRRETAETWAAVDALLQERLSFVGQLIEAADAVGLRDAYALETARSAHAACLQAEGPAQAVAAHNELTLTLRRLVAAAETTPELEADVQRLRLRERSTDLVRALETPIALYNNASTRYHNAAISFPAVLFARRLGFNAPKPFRMRRAAAPVLCEGEGLAAAMSDRPKKRRAVRTNDKGEEVAYIPPYVAFWGLVMADEEWDEVE